MARRANGVFIPLQDEGEVTPRRVSAPAPPISLQNLRTIAEDVLHDEDSISPVDPVDRSISRDLTMASPRRPRRSTGSSTVTPAEAYHLKKLRSASIKSDSNVHYPEPLPTTKCLQDFANVVAREIDPVVQEKKDARLAYSKQQELRELHTLEQLREWADWKVRRQTLRGRLANWARFKFEPRLPKVEDLTRLTTYFYPRRKEVICYVCDFGDGKFEKAEVEFGDIDDYLTKKPEWSQVRWIHCPLNVGLVQSSLEDRFLDKGRDEATSYTGVSGWPYLELETMSLFQKKRLEDMREVQLIARGFPELRPVLEELDKTALDGIGDKMKRDIIWRANHLRVEPNFWELVTPDYPRQLSGGYSLYLDPLVSRSAIAPIESQGVSGYEFYRNAQIIRYPFRAFHRQDGFLLTLSPQTGVDFLDMDLDRHLDMPIDAFMDSEDASVVGLMFELFKKTGTSTWHRKTVNWLLVYIMTEVAATPHNHRQGCNAPGLARAYQKIVKGLKDAKYAKFEPEESVNLVRDYLACIDELSAMCIILSNNLLMLEGLKHHVYILENESPIADNLDGETALERVEWAIKFVRETAEHLETTRADLREALNALFQLRSIEQNERSIIADTQNKAILVFTGVTIIFLPLSFFTSYYGMNLQGIQGTNKDETYFWKVCGTIGFLIVFGVSLYAFRHWLRRQWLKVQHRELRDQLLWDGGEVRMQ